MFLVIFFYDTILAPNNITFYNMIWLSAAP